MGTLCSLCLWGKDPRAAASAARAEVLRLEAKYSRYRDDSLTQRINARAGDPEGLDVDEETAGLLDYAALAHRESGGRFDLTTGSLRRIWDFRNGVIPTEEACAQALTRVGWSRLIWARPRLVLPLAGMELDFGGVVKEYAADAAAGAARSAGASGGYVELGGDVAVVGPQPDGSAWAIGIRDPFASDRVVARIELREGALATSGTTERGFVRSGRRYHHLLDPFTARPVATYASLSVVAAQCLVAGTATTTALLMGAPAGAEWLAEQGLPWLAVTEAGRLIGSETAEETAI